jgi:threonylcarbamoyladenosine tRNA methylthiotransferase MtaB
VASSFHIENFGCRAARADGEAIAALLRTSGAAEDQPAGAQVVIVNTCSVTAEADREARAYIRRAHRQNPEARIIATGCYAQRAPEELAAIPGVTAVIGNSHKALASEVALQLMDVPLRSASHGKNLIQIQPAQLAAGSAVILADDSFAHSFLEEAPISSGAQTRPNLKIQEGCSNRCSFCVIPQTRGNSRSLSASAVLDHVRSFVETGGKELVLSGINLGRWGRDLHRSHSEPRTMAALVPAIFQETGLPRLRLSSIEPMDWDADLIAVVSEFAGNRLARHAHLPLQSGSDSVLRRMHRRYRPWHYAEKVHELLRAAGPALTLGADVMVGFPGETDREFRESCDFIHSLPFGYLHLFPFSPRPGTRAWTLHAENPVPTQIIDERMAALRALAAEKTSTHRTRFVGAEFDAITLNTPLPLAAAGRTSALTDNFLPFEVSALLPPNRIVQIRMTQLTSDNGLLATPVGPTASQNNSRFLVGPPPAEPVLENAF